MSVLIETTIGDLIFDLYTEERPKSCLNFLKLCKIKYYNFALFHSVRRNFIAQSGDPSGSGRGGESVFSYVYGDQAKYFDLELKPRIKHRTKGTISFVNNGNDMHGSQFFITLGDGLDFLDGKHTVFGQLAEGFDTLEKLNETICDESHKPYRDVRISHTIVLEDPFDDPKGLVVPDRSPEPTKEQLESGRIGADEDIDNEGKSKEEIQRELDDKELKIGTKILETVGDIDSADLKPPENVLFVCKLNPVTNAEDLKIIFSRFGKISSCEIITDHKTGESLCYGFVEFKEVESCEKAYFKMDNVLIDDRRIHVDFCQSVAKLWNKNKASKKSMIEQQPTKRKEYELKNKSKKAKDSYEMVFDEDHTPNTKKKMNEEKFDRSLNSKKKYHDDGVNDESRDESRKKNQKNTSSTRSNKRNRSCSSSSEDEISKEKLKKKKHGLKESNESRSNNKKSKYSDSEHSSEDEYKRGNKKYKSSMEKYSTKKTNKMNQYDDSNSESDYEERTTNKNKKSIKSSKYLGSDSDRDISKKKSSKNKRDDRRRYSSSDDGDRRRSKGRKSEQSSKRKKRYEDSDTEEYTEDEPKSTKSKKSRYSSDESSDENHRSNKRRSNVSSKHRSHSSTKRRSNSYDDRRQSSGKQSSTSRRKSYKRKDESDYSDSSA